MRSMLWFMLATIGLAVAIPPSAPPAIPSSTPSNHVTPLVTQKKAKPLTGNDVASALHMLKTSLGMPVGGADKDGVLGTVIANTEALGNGAVGPDSTSCICHCPVQCRSWPSPCPSLVACARTSNTRFLFC